jgi:hypothetical protein
LLILTEDVILTGDVIFNVFGVESNTYIPPGKLGVLVLVFLLHTVAINEKMPVVSIFGFILISLKSKFVIIIGVVKNFQFKPKSLDINIYDLFESATI